MRNIEGSIVKDKDPYSGRALTTLYVFLKYENIFDLKTVSVRKLGEEGVEIGFSTGILEDRVVFDPKRANDRKVITFVEKFMKTKNSDMSIKITNITDVIKYNKGYDFVALELFMKKIDWNLEGGFKYEI